MTRAATQRDAVPRKRTRQDLETVSCLWTVSLSCQRSMPKDKQEHGTINHIQYIYDKSSSNNWKETFMFQDCVVALANYWQNTCSKSDMWKCFSVVKDENQQEITYVACKQCFTSFIYNGRKTGKYLALNVSNVQVNDVKNINIKNICGGIWSFKDMTRA